MFVIVQMFFYSSDCQILQEVPFISSPEFPLENDELDQVKRIIHLGTSENRESARFKIKFFEIFDRE